MQFKLLKTLKKESAHTHTHTHSSNANLPNTVTFEPKVNAIRQILMDQTIAKRYHINMMNNP